MLNLIVKYNAMSIKKFDKIKLLMQNWVAGTIQTTEMLLEQGFTHSDIQKYLGSQWLEQVGHGAYKRYADHIGWQGAIYGLRSKAHIGGKSALQLRSMGHYINMGKPQIDLFSNDYTALPLWFKNNDWGADMRHLKTNLLPDLAIDAYEVGNFTIKVSSPERAALELMQFACKIYSFDECKLLAENLSFLRPDIMQQLLESCTSIKAKRLILYFASSMKMTWYEKLDLKKIDLGQGYRKIVENGIYDETFKIMIPKDIDNEELRF
jgi:hypothetical protein